VPEIRLRGGDVDGLALHYLTQGRGPAILLLHGLGGFAASWRHTIEALARRATVYALDLPGFGRSAKPRADYDLPFFARTVHGFLEALGVSQVSLVGHSLGGAVAVHYAAMHPSRVDRMALVGALVPGFAYRPSLAVRLGLCPVLGETLAFLGCAPLFRAAVARCFHQPVRSEVEFLVRQDYAERTRWEARAAYLATVRAVLGGLATRASDYRRVIGTLSLPVLLVHGRQDPVVGPAHCVDAAEGFPAATIRWLDRCGHFPQIEHAEAVSGWLREFLVSRPAPR